MLYFLGESSRNEIEGSGSLEDMELKDGELTRLQGQCYIMITFTVSQAAVQLPSLLDLFLDL